MGCCPTRSASVINNICDVPSLAGFATSNQIYLDDSRRAFIERTDKHIRELVNGKLWGKHELLLGVKSVGKTVLLTTVKCFVNRHYPDVVVIMRDFSGCMLDLIELIYLEVSYRLSEQAQRVFCRLITLTDADDRVAEMEQLLIKGNIKCLLLLDEFQEVYSKQPSLGREIVQQLAQLIDSNSGVFHIVVTGGRGLAFGTLPRDENAYPSYDMVELNLRPHCIYPLVSADDFANFCNIKGISRELWLSRFITSGGRPGLITEDLVEFPYRDTLNQARLIDVKVLQSLFKYTQTMKSVNYSANNDESVEWKQLCTWAGLLRYVDVNLIDLRQTQTLNMALCRLSDEGYIARKTINGRDMVCIAHISLYFELMYNPKL